jgi:hypothetical protein
MIQEAIGEWSLKLGVCGCIHITLLPPKVAEISYYTSNEKLPKETYICNGHNNNFQSYYFSP